MQAFRCCAIGDLNLSYESLTSREMKQALLHLRQSDPDFYCNGYSRYGISYITYLSLFAPGLVWRAGAPTSPEPLPRHRLCMQSVDSTS